MCVFYTCSSCPLHILKVTPIIHFEIFLSQYTHCYYRHSGCPYISPFWFLTVFTSNWESTLQAIHFTPHGSYKDLMSISLIWSLLWDQVMKEMLWDGSLSLVCILIWKYFADGKGWKWETVLFSNSSSSEVLFFLQILLSNWPFQSSSLSGSTFHSMLLKNTVGILSGAFWPDSSVH